MLDLGVNAPGREGMTDDVSMKRQQRTWKIYGMSHLRVPYIWGRPPKSQRPALYVLMMEANASSRCLQSAILSAKDTAICASFKTGTG